MMMEVEKKIPVVTTLKNKNILIIGLARSGTGAANLLSALGAKVSITDRKSLSGLEDKIKNLSPTVRVIADCDAGEVIGSVDMIVISPGVPLHIPLLLKARMNGTPVIGELELAYHVVDSLHVHCEGGGASGPASPPIIGITGTNGKSTTTTLIDRMLNASGYRTLLGGNIGNALTEELFKAISGQQSAIGEMPAAERCQLNADYIVAEVSSFQLESIEKFRPAIAAILNITPDHLDRYRDMNDYIRAKARMFENQTSVDWLIINADDPVLMELIDEKRKVKNREMPRIAYFSREKEVDGVYSKDGVIYCNLNDEELFPSVPADTVLISVNEMRIKGIHNLENAMAAALVAIISGCPFQTVREVLGSFPGLEHRLEFVAEIGGVRFINDSKGTNVGAVAKSMGGFDSVILIMGGMDKGSDFTLLRDLIKKKVKQLILMGEAKDVIAEAIGMMTETHKVSDLREAVGLSMAKASAGDVVLLSPGCASFDMFADFEDRGKRFKEEVSRLTIDK